MIRTLVVIGIVLCAGSALADETLVSTRISTLALFKNGLAIVHREVTLPGPGTYRIEDAIEPIHGTFWIAADVPIVASTTWREVDRATDAESLGDLQRELAGATVTVFLRDASVPPITGKVVEAKTRPQGSEPSTDPFADRLGSRSNPERKYLVLETSEGRSYTDTSLIAHIKSDRAAKRPKKRQPVLLLTVTEGAGSHDVRISYLTRGIAWAASYRLDMQSSELEIEQQAVVKNELESFADADLQLISGFPNIAMQNVTSPLSLNTSWPQFFRELATGSAPGRSSPVTQQMVISNNAVAGNGFGNDDELSATPTGEGVDMHFQSIGRRSLARGEALALPTAVAKAPFEQIVEWIVPDTRTETGAIIRRDRSGNRDDEDVAWDAIRFKNPFPFAMTTAPALITNQRAFAGQQVSTWVNAGEQTTVRITKALSVRTRAVEYEDAGEGEQRAVARPEVYIAGNVYHRAKVKGELAINNHRNEEIKISIRRQFSGDLVRADADPTVTLREEGVYTINRRSELKWNLAIAAGEERTLAYEYTVLVPHR